MSSATCGVAVAVEATIASAPEPARRVGQPEVVGPEVVPPLRDAVRLVDHEEPELGLADPLEEPGRGEALGRDVEQPRAPGHRAVDRRAVRRRVLLGVDERDAPGRDALERLDLVLHQRHERRDDQREIRAHQRGQLVAERLARAGRHHHQHVAPGDRGLDRLALAGTERREAEHLAQRRGRLGGPRERSRRLRPEARQGRRDQRVGDERGGHRADDHSPCSGRHGRHLPPCREVGTKSARARDGAPHARAARAVTLPPVHDRSRPPGRRPRARGGRRSTRGRGARPS